MCYFVKRCVCEKIRSSGNTLLRIPRATTPAVYTLTLLLRKRAETVIYLRNIYLIFWPNL